MLCLKLKKKQLLVWVNPNHKYAPTANPWGIAGELNQLTIIYLSSTLGTPTTTEFGGEMNRGQGCVLRF